METLARVLLPALAVVGALLVLYVVERALDFLLFHFVLPSKPLERYRSPGPQPTYALVTGANGGIGYGIALALVKRGFGVILLGRNAAKLDAAAERLRRALVLAPAADGASAAERSAYVQTMVLDPQTAKPAEIEAAVRDAITAQELSVSILVNNVGSTPIAYPPFRELATYSADDIDGTIDLNARFMSHLTAHMLPVLTRARARALILNLSSGAKIGLPYQVMYAATKAFNTSFSVGLSRELEANPGTRQVDVLAIIAGDVKSQGNIAGLLWRSPDSDDYGRYIVERVDGAVRRGLREMSPFWLHDLNARVGSVMPESAVTKGVLDIMSMKREIMNEAMKPKDCDMKPSM